MATQERPFKIDGVAIPTPTEYTFGIEDLSSEETGRTLDGVMHKDVVDDKDYYECVWKSLSWEDAALLLNAVNKKERVMFTHADPRKPNQWITAEFYIGERGGGALNLKDNKRTWMGIKFKFIRI